MFPIPGFLYKWIAIGGVIAALGGAVWVQTARLDTVKKEYALFQAQVKAVGDAQEAATKLKDAQNKLAKEKSDAQNLRAKRDLAALYAAYGKLRDQRPSGSLLPRPATGAASPPVAAFDRSGLDRALSEFDKGVAGLLGEGDQAIVDLNSAKTWAQQAK